jgi:hypothetical protein
MSWTGDLELDRDADPRRLNVPVRRQQQRTDADR